MQVKGLHLVSTRGQIRAYGNSRGGYNIIDVEMTVEKVAAETSGTGIEIII